MATAEQKNAYCVFTTIEGNGTGKGPGGQVQHGVVRARRPVGLRPEDDRVRCHARRLIRPALADLAAGA